MTTSFRYRAATEDGRLTEGVIRAASAGGAMQELREQRLYPVDLEAVVERRRHRDRRLGREQAVALFVRTAATLFQAGAPVDRVLTFGANHARHPALADALHHANELVRTGATLSQALGRRPDVFDPTVVAMVAAGEESGAMDDALQRLARHLDERVARRSRLRAALVYPALMGIVSTVGIMVLLLFVVPRLAGILTAEGALLPLSVRVLLAAREVLAIGGVALLAALPLLYSGGRYWLRRPGNRSRWHAWRLRLPVIGTVERMMLTAALARSLAMLLQSGRALLPALQAARDGLPSHFMRDQVGRAADAVHHGQRLHTALAALLPPLATELLTIGEESGELDAACARVADMYDDEVTRTLDLVTSLVAPALILFFGVLVGLIAMAMLQAVYGMNAGIL